MEQAGKYNFGVGDTVRIIFKVVKEAKTTSTPFEGTVIAKRGDGENKTFTVRKLSSSKVTVERIFPLTSPVIQDIKVLAVRKARRAKLYFLRNR